MKEREFEELKRGEKVKIKNRVARVDSDIFRGTNYLWAFFKYCDTGRKVTKRHRQVQALDPEPFCHAGQEFSATTSEV